MILTSIPNHLKKAEKTNGGKASTIKSRKKHRNTTEKIVQPRKHTRKTAQPPMHIRKTAKPPQKKPSQKKPPSHESTTEKTVGAQSSNPVQPPKPPTVEKMVEPISKRKLPWETTAELEKQRSVPNMCMNFSTI
jgi:DNA-nicking Smr family endonuclease